uniref:Uncharacterized protein n=1 Tax=Mycena chlorophos TaxID=658473 RepID=A0ABQ0LC97_MYCCL|nr:predicted protein [Mycena chlorophos]
MFSASQPKNRSSSTVPVSVSAAPNNMPPPSRNFNVRAFKGPALSTSFAHSVSGAGGKFDNAYRPSASSDPRQQVPPPQQQPQNWYGPPPRQPPQPAPVSIPNRRARFTAWNENHRDGGRDTPAIPYADFIYERSLSSKSTDLYYSDESPSTSVSTTPTSLFSPAFSANSTLTSTPSEGTPPAGTPVPRPNAFPLHIPALAQAQSAARGTSNGAGGMFVHPNADISAQTQPPPSRGTLLPESSPPRLLSQAEVVHAPLSESPQEDLSMSMMIPPPRSESEVTVGEAERLAIRNAQMNAAGSAYYQAGFPPPLPVPMQRTQSRGSSRSPERTNSTRTSPTLMSAPSRAGTNSARTSPTMPPAPPRIAYVTSESTSTSSVTVVGDAREPMVPSGSRARVDSFAVHARHLNMQLVDLGPQEPERERRRIMTASEELRGLDMGMNAMQREAYANAFTPVPIPSLIPAVVRSDSGDDRVRSPTSERPPRERRNSGNLWSSLSQLPDRGERRSPTQLPARPSSTPPIALPRIDTSAPRATVIYSGVPAAPPPTPASATAQQSPTNQRTPVPPPLLPPAARAARPPVVAGPRNLPNEPIRRRSDGDKPIGYTVPGPSQQPPGPGLLQRTAALFHGHAHKADPIPFAERRPAAGSLPLDPQRRRSDGFQSVVPPRASPTVPALPGPPSRNVRWTENLICPSPIFANQRRKGWFNRRGDQLWTNDGAFKPCAKGQEFPTDLRDYPEYGEGWMNEDGTRIDMGHRLIPKVPLRSALKQPRGPVIQVNPGGP